MARDDGLTELEMKTVQALNQDGLMEIIIGYLLLLGALGSTLSDIGVPDPLRMATVYPLMFMGAPMIYLGKRYITTPRMGMVKFGGRRKRAVRKVGIAITCSLVALLALTVVGASGLLGGGDGPSFGGAVASAIVTLIILTIFSIMAMVLYYPRLYVVGFIFAMSEPARFILDHHTDIAHSGLIASGTAGCIITAMGLLLMVRFIKRYPIPPEEGHHVSAR